VLGYLQERLAQLAIPIRAGMSTTEAYATVRRAEPFIEARFGERLTLEHPEKLTLRIHEHPAGALPVLGTSHRPDFVTLDRALAFRNEPADVNPSVNAHLIAGLINGDRVRRYRDAFLAQPDHSPADWFGEMKRVATSELWRFYDRIMLVCAHPYSGILSRQLGLNLDEDEWLEAAAVVRLEHEFTHYATKRIYNQMRLNLLDEILCDWAGITAAMGRFEARWFLAFLGIELGGRIRPDGRVHTYRGDLNDEAFRLLCGVTLEAARGLEELWRLYAQENNRLRFLVALTRLTLELLACEERKTVFAEAYTQAGQLMGTK
jgi:hypothetical protein